MSSSELEPSGLAKICARGCLGISHGCGIKAELKAAKFPPCRLGCPAAKRELLRGGLAAQAPRALKGEVVQGIELDNAVKRTVPFSRGKGRNVRPS